jgi:hypothetical protein
LIALGLSGAGCSDDARFVDMGSPAPGNGPEGSDQGGPLYLTAALISAGDLDETHLILTDTFDETTNIDPSGGVSVVGAVVPVVFDGAVFLTEGNAPVITRYDVSDADALVRTSDLSFAGVGVAEVPSWNIYVVSATKGYVYDAGGARLVAWNPTTMELTGAAIDLSATRREGWLPNLMLEAAGPRRRGSNLLIPLSWVDQDFNYRHATGLLVIDTDTDALVMIAEDERCGEPYASVEAPNGDLYFFPSAESSAQHFFAEGFAPTCVLGVPSGAMAFGEGEPMNVSALGSGSAGSGVVPDGDDGFFFSTVDDALWESRENDGEAFWRIWHYDFETGASRQLEGLPVWAGTTYYVNVGGTPYLPYWMETPDGSRTTLYRLNGADDPTPLFSFDASWYGFNQLR